MSFNKRYVNEEVLRTVLREDGFQALIDYVKKPDALIMEDDFSSKVCSIILENEEMYILEELLKIF